MFSQFHAREQHMELCSYQGDILSQEVVPGTEGIEINREDDASVTKTQTKTKCVIRINMFMQIIKTFAYEINKSKLLLIRCQVNSSDCWCIFVLLFNDALNI